MENLFNLSIDKDYIEYGKNIEYESKRDKDKILSIIEYLKMIRPYLGDLINNHKNHRKWKVHSGNMVIHYKTQRE